MLMLPRIQTPQQIESVRAWACHLIGRELGWQVPTLILDDRQAYQAVRMLPTHTDGEIVQALRLIFGADQVDATKGQVATLRVIAPAAAYAAGCCMIEGPGRRLQIVPPLIWSDTFGTVLERLWERRAAARASLPRMVTDPALWALVWPHLEVLHETEIAEALAAQGYGEAKVLLAEVSRLVIRLECHHLIERPPCIRAPQRRRYRGASPYRSKADTRQSAARMAIVSAAWLAPRAFDPITMAVGAATFAAGVFGPMLRRPETV